MIRRGRECTFDKFPNKSGENSDYLEHGIEHLINSTFRIFTRVYDVSNVEHKFSCHEYGCALHY